MARVDEIWRRDGGRCAWCGAAPWARDRTVDHVLPRSRGGTSDLHNLLAACRRCNRTRGSQSAVAHARRQAQRDRDVRTDALLAGLDRLVEHGTAPERRYGARQAHALRDWAAGEKALADHALRRAARGAGPIS
jgi:hypothetical protein